MLLGGQKQNETDLMTPKGILLHLELHDVCMEKDTVICAVRKDAGDDPDTTNGILVYARVEKCPKSSEITVDGGKGVGRVTRPGLSQKVGEAFPWHLLQLPLHRIRSYSRNEVSFDF